ncbi:MAG TPA: SCO family protein [Streptosporangiaceae bacterium]|nr:SCO family protein [Streptosporangiaceae bacterium]
MSETGAASDRGTTTAPDPAPPGSQPRRGRLFGRSRRSTVVLGSIALVSGIAFATVFAFVLTALAGHKGQPQFRATGIPKTVSTKLATMMQLSPVPPAKAPGFTLTDQSGGPVSLASLRGRTVVLTFMDSHCTDICPLVSREFIDAYKDLGAASRNVVFIAVNVNPYHNKVADVASYSSAEGLNTIPSWHFVTGSVPALRTVWNHYQVEVRAPNKNADVIHTSLIYFIDPRGRERYVTSPMVDHTKKGVAYLPAGQLAAWGKGIALVTRASSH